MTDPSFNLSFEFFPPRTEAGKEKLVNTWQQLATTRPDFFSVTFGAGGSTRDNTFETIIDIQQNSGVDACPHLTCVGATNQEIIELLEQYQQHGIHRLVLLRGDPPSGMVAMGECKYAADLVQLVRQRFGDFFHIAVAAYPEAHPDSKNLAIEMDYFSAKMQAGADIAITQYFYNIDGYLHFIDECARQHIEQPVIPGIMPIANFTSLKKFSRQCGAEIPRWIKKSMAVYEDDIESQQQYGVEIVSRLCEKLLENGAPGLHFYTMNQAPLSRQILHNLNLAG